MTGNTNPREKVRAVFLAAIMVLSVFAMSAAFAGSAAAAAGNATTADSGAGVSDITIDHDSTDNSTAYIIDVNDDGYYNASDRYDEKATADGTSTTFEDVDVSGLDPGTTYDVYVVADGEELGTSVSEPIEGTDLSDWSNASTKLSPQAASYDIDSIDVPAAVPYGSDFTVTAVINNTGDVSGNQTVDYLANDGTGVLKNETNVKIDPGQTEEVTFTVNSENFTSATDNESEDIENGFNTTSDSSYDITTVGTDDDGTITVTILDKQSLEGLPDINVSVYRADTFNSKQDTGPLLDKQVTNDNGKVGFNGLTVGGNESTAEDYTVVAGSGTDLFDSDTTTFELYTPGQTGASGEIQLESALEPQNISIGVWDEDEQEVVGNLSTLLANGEVDNTATYVVYTQTQADTTDEYRQAIESEVTVDLTTAPGDDSGLDIARFVDANGDDAGQAMTVTIDGASDSDTVTGTNEIYSYETFKVSALGANESSMTNNSQVYPLLLNLIEGDAGADVADEPTDAAEVQYVLEGDKKVTGDVRDSVTSEQLEDVTIWAVYDGVQNESLEFSKETFVNEQGDAFLTATITESGYTINGLAGESTNFTLYAEHNSEDRYNRIDTGNEAGLVAAAYSLQTSDSADVPVTQDVLMRQEEVPLDYRLDVTVNGQKEATLNLGETTPVEVLVEERPEDSNDPDDWSPASNKDIDLDLEDTGDGVGLGSLANTTLATDASGVATTTFTANEAQVSGSLNVTAWTADDSGEVNESTGSEQAKITVFAEGKLTGDVLDGDEQPIIGSTVRLLELNESSNTFEVIRENRTLTDTSQYLFQELRTDKTYRVESYFEGEMGFATIGQAEMNPGTNTRDVAITGVVAPEGLDVTNLDAPATAETGDNITISADIVNTGAETETQTIEFRLGGDVVASQTVTVSGADTEPVSFEFTVPSDLEPGNYTHGVFTDENKQTATLTVESGYELGDVNHDGNVDATDVTLIQKEIVGLEIDGTFDEDLADVDGDGDIDPADVTRLQKIIVGLV